MRIINTLAMMILLHTAIIAQTMGNYQVSQSSNYFAPNTPTSANADIKGQNILEFKVNVLSNQKADSYTAIFNLIQVAETADETNVMLNARLEPFIASLKAMGIPSMNIYVDMVNFLPRYEYDITKKLFSKKSYNEVPKGFELQKNIHVRYTDPNALDDIVSAAAKHEIYDIVKVDYTVNNSKTIYNEARAAAFQYLEEIKKPYKTLGMALDSAYVSAAEDTWVAYPMNRYEQYQAFCSTKLDKTDDIKVTTAPKAISRFYNAVPANEYDIVINPSILEPVVQYSYSLTVMFTLKERIFPTTVKNTKEFILVTPTGETKVLKIE